MADLPREITEVPSGLTRSFGPFRLLLRERALFEGERRVSLGARAFDVLLALTDRPGELISKRELLARVWPDVHVDDAALRVHISGLRKALGPSPGAGQYIANVAGRGYRFTGQLVETTHVVTTSFSPTGEFLAGVLGTPARIIGRSFTVQALVENLPVRRCVTITGPGGIGKTTVALAVAARLVDKYRDGVQFVDLTSLSDPALVLQEVASKLRLLGLSFESGADLVASVRDRQMLLVLDNCEHLVEPVALLVERMLAAAPAVHILTTSREPLRAAGEWVHRLSPLGLPPVITPLNSAEVLNSPSVMLFVERSWAANDTFVLADDDLPSVVDICHRVDGIPLAIELAAARVDLLGVKVLAKLLRESFDLLTGGRRPAFPHQRTLRATLNWSYGLLSEEERVLLCRLAVFRDGFTLDAARAVAENRGGSLSVLDGMAALAEKSLISVARGENSTRYRLLETTRAYVSEKLTESGELPEVRRRHAEYFYLLIARAEADWPEESDQTWLTIYGHTVSDVRAAIDWSFAQDAHRLQGVSLISRSSPLWFALGLIEEYRDLAERGLEVLRACAEADPMVALQLNNWIGAATYWTLGPAPQLAAAYSRALTLATELQSFEYQLYALWGLSLYHYLRGEYPQVLKLSQEFSDVAHRSEVITDSMRRDRLIATALYFVGRLAEARTFGERLLQTSAMSSRTVNRSFHELDHQVLARLTLSRILWLQGLPDRAALLVHEMVEKAHDSRYSPLLCSLLALAACPIALWSGDCLATMRYLEILASQTANRTGNYWGGWANCLSAAVTLGANDGSAAFEAAVVSAWRLASGPFQLDVLATIRSELCSPLAVERALAGPANWCTAEVLRAQATMIGLGGAGDAHALSENMLKRSFAIAHEQGALSWQLRTAITLARLYERQGGRSKARSVLAPVYEAFSEGFGTADLKTAASMLANL